jgi:ElaB/YqjD/DUF883 family membrane-anchored ribosome-binding protein
MQGDRITTDKLMSDLKVLARDTERLLKATASHTGQQVAQVRSQAEESLKAAMARINELQGIAVTQARVASRASDDYVRANPWRVIGICAVAGFVLGSVLSRGGPSDAPPAPG